MMIKGEAISYARPNLGGIEVRTEDDNEFGSKFYLDQRENKHVVRGRRKIVGLFANCSDPSENPVIAEFEDQSTASEFFDLLGVIYVNGYNSGYSDAANFYESVRDAVSSVASKKKAK